MTTQQKNTQPQLSEDQIIEAKTEEEIRIRATQVDKLGIVDSVERDIYVRYNMDPELWRQAQRKGFPYNVPLEVILGGPLIVPLAYLLFSLIQNMRNTYYLMTVLQTVAWSLVGYYCADKLIDSFKDTLCKKGLFGRDLNKAGVQREKKPV